MTAANFPAHVWTTFIGDPILASSPAYVWVTISAGIAAIVWAFVPRMAFNAGFTGRRGKPIPVWFGRLWFIAFGLWFIYMGLHAGHKIPF
jgi:hypothetical protein